MIRQFPYISVCTQWVVRQNAHQNETLIGILDIHLPKETPFEYFIGGFVELQIPLFRVGIRIQFL